MEQLVLEEIKSTRNHKGILLPMDIKPGQLILTGPPGSGKTTVLNKLGGVPKESYLDITSRDWWKSRVLMFRPMELHFGIPFVGFEDGTPVYEASGLDDIEYLELDLFRIPLPPPKANFFSGNFRSKLAFEFLLPSAEVLYQRRQERSQKGSHHVDKDLTLRKVEAELGFYSTLALFFHQSGMQVYLRHEADGPPLRIRDETSPEDPIGMVRARGNLDKDIYHQHDQLRLRQRILMRAVSHRGNTDLLDLFTHMVPATLKVEVCNVFISDRNSPDAWLLNSSGMTEADAMSCGMHPMVMEVIKNGEYLVRETMDATPDGAPICGGIRAKNALLVPIKGVVDNNISGVILVLNTQGRPYFVEEDRILLERVALHLQLVVENVSLRQEMMDFSEILSSKVLKLSGFAKVALTLLAVLLITSLGINMHSY